MTVYSKKYQKPWNHGSARYIGSNRISIINSSSGARLQGIEMWNEGAVEVEVGALLLGASILGGPAFFASVCWDLSQGL